MLRYRLSVELHARVIDCVHLGKTLHMVLHLEPEGRLLSRGFHWINEWPNNL